MQKWFATISREDAISGMRSAQLISAIGTAFNAWGREGLVNFEAGRRSRGGCDRSVLEISSGYEFAPYCMLRFRSWSEGGAETGSAKAESMLDYDFDIGSAGVGWSMEVSGISTKRSRFGWPAVRSEGPANADFGDLPPHSRLLTSLAKDANHSRYDANCA